MNRQELSELIQTVIRDSAYDKIREGEGQPKKKVIPKKNKMSAEELDSIMFGEKGKRKKVNLYESNIPKINSIDIKTFESEILEILPNYTIKLQEFPRKDGKSYKLKFIKDINGSVDVVAVGTITNLSAPLQFTMTLKELRFEPDGITTENEKAREDITNYYKFTWKKEWSKIISDSYMDNQEPELDEPIGDTLPPAPEGGDDELGQSEVGEI